MTVGLLTIARLFDDVREAQAEGQNRGLRVEAIQHWSGGSFGDSWCAEMWWLWHDRYFKGQCPVARFQAVETFYGIAQRNGWLVPDPQVGDTFVYVNSLGHAHHIGVVTGTDPLTGIAGNTSADGLSSNGDGVHEHALTVHPPLIQFARIPGVTP